MLSVRQACNVAGLAAACFGAALLGGCTVLRPAPVARPGAAGGAAPSENVPPAALAEFSRGFIYELNNQPDEALACYLRALDLDPDNEKLYMRVAMLHLRRNRADDAIAVLQRLRRQHPESGGPWRWIGRIRAAQKKSAEAVQAFEKSIALDPSAPESYAELASLYLRTDRVSDAAALLQQALGKVPEADDLLRAAGELFVRAHAKGAVEEEKAARDLLDAITAKAPDTAEYYLFLGGIYQVGKDAAAAERAYRKVIQLDPGSAGAYVRLAALYLTTAREDEAVAILRQGIKVVEQPLDLLRVLADLHARRAMERQKDHPEEAAKDRQEAIALLRRILESTPDNPDVRLHLGDLLILGGQPEEAVAEFQKIQTDDPEVKRRLALRFLAAGDEDQAIERLRQMAEAQPGNATVWYYLGELHERKGDRDAALKDYERACQANPLEAAPYLKRALLLAPRDSAAALKLLAAAREKLPKDPRLAELSAALHRQRKEYDAAVADYARLRDLLQDENGSVPPVLWIHYAAALTKAGRIPEAVSALETAAKEDLLALEMYAQLADALDRADGKADNTRAVFRKLAEALPDEPAVPLYRGLYENFGRHYEEALTAFEKARTVAAQHPDKADRIKAPFYFWYGAACERSGRFEQAEKLLQKSLDLNPEHADAYNYLAYMWAEKGMKLDRALEYVQKALAKQPDSGAYVDTLGWIYFRQGRFEEAIKEVRRAAELMPDDASIEEHLGDVLEQLGRHDEAIKHWKRAFVLGPETDAPEKKLAAAGIDLAPLRKEAEALKKKQDVETEQGLLPDLGGAQEETEPADTNRPLPGIELSPEQLKEIEDPHTPVYP